MDRSLTPYVRIVVNHSRRCNMHCTWCHEEGMQGTSDATQLSVDEIVDLSRLLYRTGARKFKFVGGEPTLRRDLPEIIQGIRSLDATMDISMVTNGTRLSRMVATYADAGLDRINVSLFSLDPAYFTKHVGPLPLLSQAISGIDAAVAAGMCGKINHVYHSREDLLSVLAFARDRGVRVNVLNQIPSLSSPDFMPIKALLEVVESLPIEHRRIEDDPYSLPVLVLRLHDGTELEVKHQEVGDRALFASCTRCSVRSLCREGIFALRLTPAGRLQPCIVREDNDFDLKSNPDIQSLHDYLEQL